MATLCQGRYDLNEHYLSAQFQLIVAFNLSIAGKQSAIWELETWSIYF